jgi:hypothetical protein
MAEGERIGALRAFISDLGDVAEKSGAHGCLLSRTVAGPPAAERGHWWK